jgi:two-component system, cell cycle response regulator
VTGTGAPSGARAGSTSAPTRPRNALLSRDIVPLTERMGFLQALRVSFAVVVVGAVALAEEVVGGPLDRVTLVTASYLLFSAMAEAGRRLMRRGGLSIAGISLLVDGIYLAWIMYLTGGMLSPLSFLFYIHLIAVTLLASYRTGLKLALWYSLLFLTVYYAQASGMLDVREGIATALPGRGPLFNQVSVFHIAALWFVAIATAVFSSLNERELRRRRAEAEILADMATELEEVRHPTEVAAVLLQRLREGFGVKRGLVLAGRDRRLRLLSYVGPGEPPPFPDGVDPLIEQAWGSRDPVLTGRLDDTSAKRLSWLLPFARNLVVVPLFSEGDPVGALVIEYPGSRIEKRVLSVMVQMAAHAALALGNAWLLGQAQRDR